MSLSWCECLYDKFDFMSIFGSKVCQSHLDTHTRTAIHLYAHTQHTHTCTHTHTHTRTHTHTHTHTRAHTHTHRHGTQTHSQLLYWSIHMASILCILRFPSMYVCMCVCVCSCLQNTTPEQAGSVPRVHVQMPV